MKLLLSSVLAVWAARQAASRPVALDLKGLELDLWGPVGEKKTGESFGARPPIETPEGVFLQRTTMYGNVVFTWIKPSHAAINGLTFGEYDVWKGEPGELILDVQMFLGKKVILAHIEYLTDLGAIGDLYLSYNKGPGPSPPKVLGISKFTKSLAEMLEEKRAFLGLKYLPAFKIFNELGLYWNLGLAGVPQEESLATGEVTRV